MNYTSHYPAAIIITDTNTHTGRFGKIHALSQAVIETMVAENITENGSSNTITSVVLKQNVEVEGVITSIKLSSGELIAYRL
tara:strand:+ start:256 stop:501 length:246 start_codon:yes stop_codon:yes gene_type:complete